MTNELVIRLHTHERTLSSERELAEDWDQITTDCGWNGTGGDWRRYAAIMRDMVREAQLTGERQEHVVKYDPFISVEFVSN